MNVIVLTPDRVGSTLLQKYLSVTMQNYDYGKPVVNLHELTNGLEKYHSTKYNQDMIGKPHWQEWGYHQSLKEVVALLSSVDQYSVSRLAQYHINNRKDSLPDQLSLYKYINNNFFIISARRENLFEHALSWCIVNFTKHLNLFEAEHKMMLTDHLHKNKITIDQIVFENYLDKYVKYLEWVDDHFGVNSIFSYETHLKDLEGYVNNLDIFPPDTQRKSWKELYNISWNDWNKCHYLSSDKSGFSKLKHNVDIKLLTDESTNVKMNSELSVVDTRFLNTHLTAYKKLEVLTKQLHEDRNLLFGIPIKLQTLAEKALIVKNFKDCLDTYNNWSSKNNIGKTYTLEELGYQALAEARSWYNIT